MLAKKILLVEDNPDDIQLTMRALSKGNVANALVVAKDGVEALDFFAGKGTFEGRDTSILPAVVLLDIKLPRIDGLEVLRRLRSAERTRFLPVIILTSSREERDLIEAYKSGINSYVRKPVDFNEFADAVRQLGLYWLLINEPPPG